MTMKKSKVFIDSSVIIAGLASSSGGSNRILILCELDLIRPYISEQVVREVLKNVEHKLPALYEKTYLLFRRLPFRLQEASEENLVSAAEMINEKDAPILAAAMSGKVDCFLTLDKHFLEGQCLDPLSFWIGTPGDFLGRWPEV